MLLKLSAIGHLGRDPEMSYTPAGKAVTRFSLATSRKWTDSATHERREETTWLNCTAFDRLGETVNNYTRKGSKVYIEGRPTARPWLAKDGAAQASLDVVITDLVLLDPKGAGNAEGQGATHANATATAGASAPVTVGPGETAGDDLPF